MDTCRPKLEVAAGPKHRLRGRGSQDSTGNRACPSSTGRTHWFHGAEEMWGVTAQTTAEEPATAVSTLGRSLMEPTTDEIRVSLACWPL